MRGDGVVVNEVLDDDDADDEVDGIDGIQIILFSRREIDKMGYDGIG